MSNNSTSVSSPEDPLLRLPAQAGMPTSVTALREAVRKRRVGYDVLLRESGHLSAYDFVKSYLTVPTPPPREEIRKKQFIAAVKDLVHERLDASTAKSVAAQLEKYYSASTTDHFGPLHHPWVLHYTMLASLVMDEHPDPLLKHHISLAYASVSFNNCYFPRGVTYTSSATPAVPVRIPLFPNSVSSRCVYNFRAYSEADLQNAARIVEQESDAFGRERLGHFVRNIFGGVCKTALRFTEQVTKSNFHLWRAVRSALGLRKAGELVYLDIETLTARLLAEQHCAEPTSRLYRTLFDPAYAASFRRLFADLPETFSFERKKGTYLFWHITPEERRVSLWPEGDDLVSVDGTVRFACTPAEIAERLRRRELMPSTLMTFLTCCFEHGLHCLGGLGQITYLPRMQEAWMQLLQETGEPEVAQSIATLPGRQLGGELILLFLEHRDAALYPATVMDVLLYADGMTGQLLREQAKTLSLTDALDPTLPDDYSIVYSGEERSPELSALRMSDVSKVLQDSGKLQAALSVPLLSESPAQPRSKTVQSRLLRESGKLRMLPALRRLLLPA